MIKGAIVGAAILFGAVGCATTPVDTGPTEAELAEQARLEAARAEAARLEAERIAAEEAERARLAAERAEAERLAAEAARLAELGAPGSEKEFKRLAGERVYFDVDQWRLSDEGKATLAKQADWLQKYPSVTLIVAGNCDERGTREYNIALGERRANVVRDYLVSLGVSGDRVSVTSNGKDLPWVAGSGPQVWAQNRNGHTQLVDGFTGAS